MGNWRFGLPLTTFAFFQRLPVFSITLTGRSTQSSLARTAILFTLTHRPRTSAATPYPASLSAIAPSAAQVFRLDAILSPFLSRYNLSPPGLTAPAERRQTRRNTAVALHGATSARADAHRLNAEPVKAAQRAPAGLGLDGHRFFTLGHAVQDDSAACTACTTAFVFRFGSRRAAAHFREPLGGGREGGCEHGAEAASRPQPARSRRPGGRGSPPLPGRFAAPDFILAQHMPGAGGARHRAN